MKLNPVDIILSSEINKLNRLYLISGNEITLINKVKEKLIEKFKKKSQYKIESEFDNNFFLHSNNLFNEKRIFILDNISSFEIVSKEYERCEDIFIYVLQNSPKNNKIKNSVSKNNNFTLVDCYELSKNDKVRVFNYFIEKFDLKINGDVFWEIIDALDNKYLFLEKEIEKIFLLNTTVITSEIINKTIVSDSIKIEGLFFDIFKKNSKIVLNFKKKVADSSQAYELFQVFKRFSNLIIENETITHFNQNIPRYLFREKKSLIEIYNKYNLKKRRDLLNLIRNTESILRSQSNLAVVITLRFILSFKRITFS